MATLTAVAFISKWTSRFADNTSREISEGDMREFAEDIKDSFSSILGSTEITSWKAPCVVATTGNITLSGEQTIDGVLTSTSRVLVKNQNTQSQNGIYVSEVGAWSRATDADSAAELEGAAVGVTQGTAGQNSIWVQTTDNITLETSSIVWQQIGFGVSSQSLDEVLSTGNDGGGLAIENIADPTNPQDAATKAWVEAQLVSAGVSRVKVAVSASEIRNLFTTPKTLIAAPGANKVIQYLFGHYKQTFGTTVFNLPSTAQYSLMIFGNVVDGASGLSGTNMNSGSTISYILSPSWHFQGRVGPNFDLQINNPLTWGYAAGGAGNATQGDSTGEWIIYYRIIDLS